MDSWNVCAWHWGWSRQAIFAALVCSTRLAPRDTCTPQGDLKVCCVWQLVSSARWYCWGKRGFCLLGCAWSTRFWWYLEGRLPWVVTQNGMSWVMTRDSGWTWGTLELWLRLASVAGVSVRVMACTDGSN